MKILLITISARGHAIAEALARSKKHPEIIHICPQRNPGIRKIAKEQHVLRSLMDFPAILDIAKRTKPDFAFIAPDDPIGGGLADELEKIGIPSIAPKKSLARIESSKGFTRELLKKYKIDASPKFRVFSKVSGIKYQVSGMRSFIEDELKGEYVVKYDGLAGGKGVKVSGEHLHSIEEGVAYAEDCLKDSTQVVIEEKLIGVEFSLMSFVSGLSVVSMPAVQDHKRAFEGDTGPNTGGMGTYSDADHSLPFLSKEDLAEAHALNERTAKALMEECGEPYKGILYGGFIATASGVKLIEYNARFGDPEALNVLPILSSDFVEICEAILNGNLDTNIVTFEKKATVCLYITPDSYPERKDRKGEIVKFPNEIPSNARLYFGDIAEDPDGSTGLTTGGTLHLGGSRTAGIVGIGDSIEEARETALRLAQKVEGPVRFRADIGSKELIEKRIEMMKSLRGGVGL